MATPETIAEQQSLQDINSDYTERYGFHDAENYLYKAPKGLTRELVEKISEFKSEPEWMREFRLKALDHFLARPMPTWGSPMLAEVNFDDIHYFVRASERAERSWDDVPEDVKKTFDRLGIPEAERKFLAGVGAQYESEVVYHQVNEALEKQGVIFMDMDTALREHEDIVREYFATIIPANDNKLAALNSAVWSGGSFVYVPPGVNVEMPLQAYFRINTENMGQFERTLIIADEGSHVHYVEGCHLAGSMVRVRGGEKPIEEIEAGDEVLTHRGRFRRVTKPMRRARTGPIHHIRFQGEGYRSLAVTPGHPFLVARRTRPNEHNRTFEPEWLTAQELREGDYLAVPTAIDLEGDEPPLVWDEDVPVGRGRHAAVAERVGVVLDPKMCRVMGLYLAEGSVSADTSYLSFDSATGEQDLRELVTSVVEGAFEADAWEYDYAGARAGRSLRFSSVRAARFFSQAFGRTTDELRIPDWVFSLREENRAALVRGLYDGEGSYDPKLDLHRISQTNRHVAQRLRELLSSLGIRSTLSVTERPLPRRPIWQLAISKVDHPRFEELVLGAEARPARATHAHTVMADGYLWQPISSIETVHARCEVFNMSVQDDESYVCEGVVSHNCTAPTYSSDSLHSAVVELIAKPGARIRYTTVQNWSQNVFNLVTKRAVAQERATVEWVDCNLGSKLTMKYPSVYLMGEEAHGEILSIAFAGAGQHQDAGGKIVHVAPRTTSNIFAKSISKDGGRSSYRGLLEVAKGATGARSKVVCDALLLDEHSRSDTYPTIRIGEDDVDVGHEATVSKIGDEQVYYLQCHGISEEEASKLIVNGFIEPITKELPMEYAVEMNRLIELQMEGSIG
ncbi:MAG TPA: SufD family Fe-S cluster assembly protein [Thermoleophilaceae bacterium]|nr:SufD family Fe-S cluster assembly protein [Thermoleophilaceae bacterium]